jgi:hypothetical protein
MFCLVSFWIMPAMASEPPEGISTVVSARRVRIEGTLTVCAVLGTTIVIELVLERSETSVMTLRLMRPSLSTTGVKLRLTPNFLNWIEGWQTDATGPTMLPLEAAEHEKPLRTGNSPPATKVAISPEIAVKFGSASV